MFLFSITAQELKQALKGSGKIKLCLSGVLSQRSVVYLPPELSMHFMKLQCPYFPQFQPVKWPLAPGNLPRCSVLPAMPLLIIMCRCQSPQREGEGRGWVIDPYTTPAGVVALVQKLLCFLVPKVLGSIKQERRLSVNHLSSLLATTFS